MATRGSSESSNSLLGPTVAGPDCWQQQQSGPVFCLTSTVAADRGGLPSSNLTSWASSNCSAEGVGTDSACPGCNNSFVKSSPENPRGCGRGNPNNTIAPGWCPFHMFRTGGDIGPDFAGT